MKLVLLGYMGSGKTMTGKVLAKLLNYRFIDLDERISERVGMPISDIFKTKGEIYFRRIEKESLRELLDSNEAMVISTGGGTPCYGDTMHYMLTQKNVITIYLKVSFETLTDRLMRERESRPLISHLKTRDELNDFIRKHLFERAFYYNQANMTINCDEFTSEEISNKIIARLF